MDSIELRRHGCAAVAGESFDSGPGKKREIARLIHGKHAIARDHLGDDHSSIRCKFHSERLAQFTLSRGCIGGQCAAARDQFQFSREGTRDEGEECENDTHGCTQWNNAEGSCRAVFSRTTRNRKQCGSRHRCSDSPACSSFGSSNAGWRFGISTSRRDRRDSTKASAL